MGFQIIHTTTAITTTTATPSPPPLPPPRGRLRALFVDLITFYQNLISVPTSLDMKKQALMIASVFVIVSILLF